MRKFVLAMLVITGALLVTILYKQLVVERSFGPAALVAVILLGLLFLALLVTAILSRTRHSQLVGKLWLAAASTVISYFVLDLVAGKLLIQPLSPPLVPDEHRHHKLVPDSHAEFRQQDFAYVQRVNHLGLRGPEVELRKPSGTFRILMLGDSFTMGKGVEDDETFSALLGRDLEPLLDRCTTRVEVINGGVDSYAPVLANIYLQRELAALGPDLVVMNLDVSDLAQEAAYRSQGIRGPDGSITAVPQRHGGESLYDRVRDWTQRNLFFTRVLLFQANKLMGYRDLTVRGVVTEANAEIVAHTLADDAVDRRPQWEDIFDSLRRMRDFSRSRGAEFVLTVYPWPHQYSPTAWIPGRYVFMPEDAQLSDASLRTITEFARRDGIELLDLYPAFRAYRGAEKLYFDNDMHWTAAGHAVVAGGYARYLMSRYGDAWCAAPGPASP